jgi:hypothetical protein
MSINSDGQFHYLLCWEGHLVKSVLNFFINIGEKKEHFGFVALNGICSQRSLMKIFKMI